MPWAKNASREPARCGIAAAWETAGPTSAAIYWPKLATPQAPPERSFNFTPDAAVSPVDRWQEKALALVTWAHERLLETPDQLEYLELRGIPLEAVQRFRIGCNPEDRFRSRKVLGPSGRDQ